MQFRSTPLAGAVLVEIEPHRDVRGFFARTWCSVEFAAAGLANILVQASMSRNQRRGTVRGMHMQLPPSAEAKLVRCARGAIHDVIVDLRPHSPTYLRNFSVELTAHVSNALYIPPLMAHGFQTLEDDTDVLYCMSDVYSPELACGFRWNDSVFQIDWPIRGGVTIVPRDRDYPDFNQATYLARLNAAGAAGES